MAGEPHNVDADIARVRASDDQHRAMVRELVDAVTSHWDDPACPGGGVCLGHVSFDIAVMAAVNPAAVANALQGAVSMLAEQQYERRGNG